MKYLAIFPSLPRLVFLNRWTFVSLLEVDFFLFSFKLFRIKSLNVNLGVAIFFVTFVLMPRHKKRWEPLLQRNSNEKWILKTWPVSNKTELRKNRLKETER